MANGPKYMAAESKMLEQTILDGKDGINS